MPSFKPLVLKNITVGLAVCVSSVPATAAPGCLVGAQGCVLPLRDAVAAPVQPVEPVPTPVVGPIEVEEPKGFPLLAVLGLLAAAVLAYGLLTDNDIEAEPLSP